jgi:cobalt/nickel transport protein
MKIKNLLFWIAAILLTPVGLLTSGVAWGEWSLAEIKAKFGFAPQGMSRFSRIIKNVLPDYGIPGFDKTFVQSAVGYILSAVAGLLAIAVIFWLLAKLVPEKKAKSS